MKRIYFVVFFILFLTACGGNETPIAPTVPQDASHASTTAIVSLSGGLGFNQLSTTLETSVKAAFPNYIIVNDSDWDGYAHDQSEEIIQKRTTPDDRIFLIGHSFGGQEAIAIANRLNEKNVGVDLLILFDPVIHDSITKLIIPSNVKLYRWYKPTSGTPFVVSGTVEDATYKIVSGDHNSITHDETTVREVLDLMQ